MIEVIESVPSIAKSVTVPGPADRAFALFTDGIDTWWPAASHSFHGDEVERLVWEPHVGGAVYEVSKSGERKQWATVLTWEPPHRFVLAWEVNPAKLGTEVEVRFSELDGVTRVDLEHRGFDNVTDGAAMRASYDPGWDAVLAHLGEAR